MNPKIFFATFALLIIVTLAGCGGGGSDPVTPPQQPPTSSTTKASDYTGSWSGKYTLAGVTTAANIPVSFTITGIDATSIITGSVFSQYVAGAFIGTIDTQGVVAGTVANTLDGQAWQMTFTKTIDGINITSLNYGFATTGTGSCSAKPSLAFDLTGEYPVRYKQTFPAIGATYKTGRAILAYDGLNGFTGAIVGDTDGLKAKLDMFKFSGYWFVQIHNGAMGTYIDSSNGLLTQSPPISDALLTAALTDVGLSLMTTPLYCEMYGSSVPSGSTTIYEVNIYLEGVLPAP